MLVKRNKGYTLVEVIIAIAIFSLLLAGVYKLFIGGSQTAGKGQWINGTVDQLRTALSFISTEIRSATYPTTMFSDTIYDPCDNTDKSVASQFYMRILKEAEPINVPDSGELLIMSWNVCSAEKPDNGENGKLLKHELYLVFKNKAPNGVNTGDLVMKTTGYEYTTSKQNKYAKSGKLNLTDLSSENRVRRLVNDVENVEFSVQGVIPPQKAVDFFPISVKIRTLYLKDTKVNKENSIMSTPQVAIDLLQNN